MTHSLLSFPVRSKKDIVVLRQRTRQIAGMLGYAPQDEAAIAAAAFAIVSQTFRQHGNCTVHFTVADHVFQVCPVMDPPRTRSRSQTAAHPSRFSQGSFEPSTIPPAAPLRLEKPLPSREPPLADEDLGFVARELDRLTPPNLFAEIERQNQELLGILVELRSCQAKLSELNTRHTNPSAA